MSGVYALKSSPEMGARPPRSQNCEYTTSSAPAAVRPTRFLPRDGVPLRNAALVQWPAGRAGRKRGVSMIRRRSALWRQLVSRATRCFFKAGHLQRAVAGAARVGVPRRRKRRARPAVRNASGADRVSAQPRRMLKLRADEMRHLGSTRQLELLNRFLRQAIGIRDALMLAQVLQP
jgi:hypothetical protein